MKSLEHIDLKNSLTRLGDYDLYLEILRIFLDQTEHMLSDIEKNVLNQDMINLRRLAHSFKSNCATIGAFECEELAAKLELAAANNSSEAAELFLLLKERAEPMKREAQHILSYKDQYSL